MSFCRLFELHSRAGHRFHHEDQDEPFFTQLLDDVQSGASRAEEKPFVGEDHELVPSSRESESANNCFLDCSTCQSCGRPSFVWFAFF